MHPGSNGPPVLNGLTNNYDRLVSMDAPVAMDTGIFADPSQKSLARLREDMMVRMGYAAMLASPPPGLTEELNSFLYDAQMQLASRYADLRTERWWAWQAAAGQRLFDVPIDGTAYLDMRRVTWAGIADNGGRYLRAFGNDTAYALGDFVMPNADVDMEYEVTTAGTSQGDGIPAWPSTAGATVVSGSVTLTARARAEQRWYPLLEGIAPTDYNITTPGIPTNIRFGRHIEIWPPPSKPYVLWIRGFLGLAPFQADTDYCTIDTHAVFLFALALAKAHRGQGDARNYADMANRRIHDLIAGSHGMRRYIPQGSTGGIAGPHCADLPMPKGTWR